MGYTSLIDNSLKKAFNLVKDLAVDAVFTKKVTPSFNFNTASAEFGTNQTVSTKVVIVDINKVSKDRSATKKQLLVKSKDIGDINQYTTVSINAVTWNIGEITKGNGFINLVNIYREA